MKFSNRTAWGRIARRMRSLGLAAAGCSLVWPSHTLAAEPQGQHGAAAMSTQQAALQKLLVAPSTATPPGVDAQIWHAAVPADNALSAARIALGRDLYFETALSKDRTVACATCHDATRSFTDRRKVSEGVGNQTGKRNAPTTLNAALLQSQFWDGRAATLEDQAQQPILNPVEMAMPDEAAAVAALKAVPGYADKFRAAYGRDVNYQDVARAIAAFERTLIFLDAPFDRFTAGDKNAISPAAQRGWELFNGKARCISCHPINFSNPLGTDHRFHNIGVSARHQDFEALAKRALAALRTDDSVRKLDELAVASDLSELGRFMVTRSYADVGGFRTSQIRNIGITGPYMHDGSIETLWDVMDHYNKGGEANPFLDGGIEPLALSEREIEDVVAFMFALTDGRFAALNRAEEARQEKLARSTRPLRDEALSQRRIFPFEARVMTKGGTP